MPDDLLDRFDAVVDQRTAFYERLAVILWMHQLPAAAQPHDLLAAALQEAYRAGARDMHTTIAEQLKPLWICAGLEP